MSKNKEVVFHGRHPQGEEAFLEKGGEMAPDELLLDSFDSKSFLSQYFSDNLYSRGWWSDHIIIPFFVFIVFLLSAFGRITRKSLTLIIMLILLYFLLLGPPGKMYAVFYKVLPMFKVIHSFSCFWLAFIGIFILFAALQWRMIIQAQFGASRRGKVVILILVHLAALAFLLWQGNTIAAFYLTLFLSFVYFCITFFFKEKMPGFLLIFLLLVCAVAQPIEAMWYYRGDPFIDKNYKVDYVFPASDGFLFRYVRPDYKGPVNYKSHLRHVLQMRDFISYFGLNSFPCRWTAYFFENFPKEITEGYVKYKFYVYDKGQVFSGDENQDLTLAKEVFQGNLNLALIDKEGSGNEELNFLVRDSAQGPRIARIIKGKEEEFFVSHFDTNAITIETNFNKKKFLVYNDSYHKDWKLFLNGKSQKIYRANIAFKGIILPAGKNVVRLVYAPLGGQTTYFLIFVIYVGMFLWVVFLFIKDLKYFNHKKREK